MPLVDQDPGLLGDLLLRECPSFDFGVAGPEGAVEALIGAEVRDIERGEDHQPLPVDFVLHFLCGGEQSAQQGGIADGGEGGHVGQVEPFHEERLFQNGMDMSGVRRRSG